MSTKQINRDLRALALITLFLSAIHLAEADTFVWTGSAGDNDWNNPANWSNTTPGGGSDSDGIPDGDDDAGFDISATTANGTAENLSIGGLATLSIAPGSIAVNTGTINNQNILTFAGQNNGSETLGIIGSVALSGGGEVVLVDGNSFIADFSGGAVLTNADNLIHGGNGGTIAVNITNQSIVRADNLVLNLSSITITNSGGGSVEVKNGATLAGNGNSTVSGGTLDVETGAAVQNLTVSGDASITGGTATFTGAFDGVSNAATVQVASGSLTLQNTIDNTGILTFSGSGSTEQLGILGAVTLSGGGEVVLVDGNSFISDFSGGAVLTNMDNLIHGGGGGSINVAITNQSIVRADDGVLNLGNTITNSGSGSVEVKNGATLAGGTVSGGTLDVETGAAVQSLTVSGGASITGGTATFTGAFDGVSNAATVQVASGSLTLQNAIDNTGILTFSGSGSNEQLGIIGTVTLSGGGEVVLVDGNSFISDFSGGAVLTNVDNLIHGGGGGTIQVAVTNQATIRADNGVLNINAAITNTDGTVEIDNGATLVLNSTITGGTLSSEAGGLLSGGTLDGVTNTGTTTIAAGSSVALQNSLNNTGILTFSGSGSTEQLGILGAVTLSGGGEVVLVDGNSFISDFSGGAVLTNMDNLIHGGGGGTINVTLINQGTTSADDGLLNLTGTSTNDGIFEALDASSLLVNSTLTNNMAGVLTGGAYRSVASGNGATITIQGDNITEIDSGTEVVLSGAGSIFQVSTTALESTLTTVAGALRALAGRNYTNTEALTDSGVIELGGGLFNAASLSITSTGEFFGFGTVALRPTNSGLIRSAGGTLTFANGIQGGSGTVQTDAGSTMSLSGGSSGSDADFLINNGTLALGGNNFTVEADYTNANFGIGNSFNPRANVTGAALILASGNVGQSLTGTGVDNGTSAAPSIDFGNVHVGDMNTVNYRINNTGTSGPALRGALQTSVNGGNLTDSRLEGSGVTASNFGPVALGDDSSDFAVTFDATAAGALTGQVVHLINNFDNVAEQNLSITGAAFRFANPTAHTPEPIAFGNFHVGDTPPSQALSLTNDVPDDNFSEALNASIGNVTGGVTASGSFNLLGPGETNDTSLSVGISTGTAGSKNGTATITLESDGTGSSGLGITSLTSQTVNITGSVFRLADPSAVTPSPVEFANSHVGDAVTQVLSLSNLATNDGFSERLDASFSGMTGDVSTSGSAQISPGGTNNTSLVVGLDTSAAGARSGSATLGLISNGAGSSGLGMTTLTSQTVNISGDVYRFADPGAHTPEPIDFGNFHVDDTAPSQLLSLANNAAADGFSEALNASLGSPTGGVTTNSGAVTIAPGNTNNTGLSVGLSTASAGNRNGTATITLESDGAGSSGLGVTALTSQIVNVTGSVYRLANPTGHSPAPVNFGVVHVGETAPSQALSITNNVANDNFSEALDASIGGATGGVTTNGGSFSNLAPGGTNDTALAVGISTASAGMQDGTATITLASDGDGSSELGITSLPSQTVNVTGQVNFFADPLIVFKSGDATLTQLSETLYRLDFGTVAQDSGLYLASFGIENVLQDATFQDTLGGSFDTASADDFGLDGFDPFSGIAPGGRLDPDVTFNSSMAVGSYADSVFYIPTSSNASGTDTLTQIQLDFQARIVPEPGTWAMIAIGGGMLVALRRAGRRSK